MNAEERVNISSSHVKCDGGEDGHPLIYLEVGDNNTVTCPYCGKIFVYNEEN